MNSNIFKKSSIYIKNNLFSIITLLVIIPTGISTKFYKGPFYHWVNDSSGGIFYEIFWIIVFSLLFKRMPLIAIVISVLAFTSLLEFLQLVHIPILNAIRSTFVGQALIGNSFNKTDFIYYVIGCLAGWKIASHSNVTK